MRYFTNGNVLIQTLDKEKQPQQNPTIRTASEISSILLFCHPFTKPFKLYLTIMEHSYFRFVLEPAKLFELKHS